jgi:hypothetical protein
LFSRAEDKLKLSDDEIEQAFRWFATVCRDLFHALRCPMHSAARITDSLLHFLAHGWTTALGRQAGMLQWMQSRVNDMISATYRMAYTRRSNGQAFKHGLEFQKEERLTA